MLPDLFFISCLWNLYFSYFLPTPLCFLFQSTDLLYGYKFPVIYSVFRMIPVLY